ncbi:hypothetical protein ILYODFUR_027996 [Ilyodon furcidens]|uniref:Uncharacterized protein n=1 Tax=Ilyodon furcidens TaxID=33524 RepID=A0ABV0UVW0_9TELE
MVSRSGSVGYIIMRKTGQMDRRQSQTPSTRRVSHRRSLLKKLVAHTVLYPNILIDSLEKGRGCFDLERALKQSPLKTLGEVYKVQTTTVVSALKATAHRCIQH